MKSHRRSLALLSLMGPLALAMLAAMAGTARAEEQVLPQFFNECWGCSFVGQFMQIGDVIAFNVYDYLAAHIGTLLSLLFGIWTLVQAMKLFLPGTDGYDVLKTLGKRSLLFAIIFTAATSSAIYEDWIYGPALKFGAKGAGELLVKVEGLGGKDLGTVFRLNEASVTDWDRAPVNESEQISPAIDEVVELVGKMQKINGYGFWAGWMIFSEASWDIVTWAIRVPAGALLMLSFGVAFVAFPFYIIDLFFRVFLLTALAPGLFGALGFGGAPRSAAIAALKGVLQSALTVLLLGLAFVFTASLMASVVVFIPETGGTFDGFLTWLDGSTDQFSFADSTYWFLLASGIMATAAVGKVRGVVGALIGGFDDGKSMGDKASSLAQGGIQSAGGAAMTGMAVGGMAFGGGLGMLGAKLGTAKYAGALKAIGGGLQAGSSLAAGLTGTKVGQGLAMRTLMHPSGMQSGNGGGPGDGQ